MAAPVVSVRATPRAARTVRLVAKALRRQPSLAHDIETLIEGASAGGARRNIGPFRDEDEALVTLVGRLVAQLSPIAIYLIGSRARGDARPDSDFDLVILLPSDGRADVLDYEKAYEPVMGLGVGCDVVPYPSSAFEADKDVEGTLAFEADKHGRLLFSRGPAR